MRASLLAEGLDRFGDCFEEMRQVGSFDQVAGGWAVGSSRVSAVEDGLTALEASAWEYAGRTRARGLRDAVRASRARMQELVGSAGTDTLPRDLDAVATELEAALEAANLNGRRDPSGALVPFCRFPPSFSLTGGAGRSKLQAPRGRRVPATSPRGACHRLAGWLRSRASPRCAR